MLKFLKFLDLLCQNFYLKKFGRIYRQQVPGSESAQNVLKAVFMLISQSTIRVSLIFIIFFVVSARPEIPVDLKTCSTHNSQRRRLHTLIVVGLAGRDYQVIMAFSTVGISEEFANFYRW